MKSPNTAEVIFAGVHSGVLACKNPLVTVTMSRQSTARLQDISALQSTQFSVINTSRACTHSDIRDEPIDPILLEHQKWLPRLLKSQQRDHLQHKQLWRLLPHW